MHLARAAPVEKTERDAPNDASASDGSPMRRRIVEYATPIFAERGYDGVRLHELARELGIAKATLYRHFRNKQALFIDCVARVTSTLLPAEVRERTQEYSVEREGDVRARAVLQHFDAYRTIMHLLGAVAHGSDPELAARAREQFHQISTEGVPLIRRAIRERARPLEPELLAYMLWGAIMGAGQWMTLRGELSLERVLEQYVELVRFGLVGPGQRSTSQASRPV